MIKRFILALLVTLHLFTCTLKAQNRSAFRAASAPSGVSEPAYNIEQATSGKAQLNTISFDALAFLTGNFGADCFFPPGKVADFFGFQYMRDNDSNQLGHNTDFLTLIANNVIRILDTAQLIKLIALAKEQEPLYEEFAKKRIVLVKAFRDNLEGHLPAGSSGLNKDSVVHYCGELYRIDASLSYRRAEVMADIIRTLSGEQKKELEKLSFLNSATWPKLPELVDKKSLSHRAHVALMTYAGELFSWYKGSVVSDTYFCPERHGTYFGGFYLKDYPAMGNHGYSISTSLTGNSGAAFLNILNSEQKNRMEALPVEQNNKLSEIVRLRTAIADNLRKFIRGEKVNKDLVFSLIMQYGREDGEMSYCYAVTFKNIYSTLTVEQKKKLSELRNRDQLPLGIFDYSDPVKTYPEINCSFLFY